MLRVGELELALAQHVTASSRLLGRDSVLGPAGGGKRGEQRREEEEERSGEKRRGNKIIKMNLLPSPSPASNNS